MRLALACLALVALAASAAASVIVVRAVGPVARSHPVGRTFPDNVRFRLGAGESVTVVASGGTRTFRGPGTYSPSDPIRAGERGGPDRRNTHMFAAVTMSSLERGRADGPSVLVVRASGPSVRSYPPGRPLPVNARLILLAGDVLVVLDAGGRRTFRGPGTIQLNRGPPSRSGFVGGVAPAPPPPQRPARIGAVREAGIAARPPSIWHIDAGLNGTICLPPGAGPTLWRADSAAAATLTVTAADGTARAVAWPAGQATLDWPADLAATDGGEYSLQYPGLAVATRIRVARLARAPADLPGVAAALIERGCEGQLDLLTETAPDLTGSPVAGDAPARTVLVDIGRNATICLAPEALVALTRARDEDMFLEIRAARGRGAILDWVRGAGPLPWPTNLPLADRSRYTMRRTDGTAQVQITFRTLPQGATGEAGDDPVAVANALIARGCQSQLDRLIDANEADETAPAG